MPPPLPGTVAWAPARGHEGTIKTCTIQGRTVYTGSMDHTVAAWHAPTGDFIWRSQPVFPEISSIAAHHSRLFVGTQVGIISLDLGSMRRFRIETTHSWSQENTKLDYKIAELMPSFDFFLTACLLVFETVQLAGFAFKPATPPAYVGLQEQLNQAQDFGLPALTYTTVQWCVASARDASVQSFAHALLVRPVQGGVRLRRSVCRVVRSARARPNQNVRRSACGRHVQEAANSRSRCLQANDDGQRGVEVWVARDQQLLQDRFAGVVLAGLDDPSAHHGLHHSGCGGRGRLDTGFGHCDTMLGRRALDARRAVAPVAGGLRADLCPIVACRE